MYSTSNATFVAHERKVQATESDLNADEFSQAIIVEVLRRYWGLDFAKATISGIVGTTRENKLAVRFYHNGDLVRAGMVDAVVNGMVDVHIEGLCAIGTDIEQIVMDAWLPRLGLPSDYPCGVEIEIRRGGAMSIELTPCF